jgi:MFS family permease
MEVHLRTWPGRLLARPWLLAFVPVNAATSGFGVAFPLLLLITHHGAWVDVAVAASLFNAAVVLSSMFWGYIADKYPSRRKLLLFNFVGFALLYVVIGAAPSIPLLFLLYTIVGVISPAGANAANLLILERFPESERPQAYASLQEMSILGAMGGLLIGYVWLTAAEPLAPLLYLLAALALASVLAVWIGVRDPTRPAKSIAVAHHAESLAHRLHPGSLWKVAIPFFPKVPHLDRASWSRFRAWARAELTHELPLIFAAMFLFNLASNLFNISYTPYLYSLGLGAAAIFLVNFANNFAQGLSFPASGGLTSRLGPDRVVQRATYVRGLGYLAVAGFTFVPFLAGAAFAANAIAFGILGVAIAFYTTSSSIVLFRAIRGKDAGRILGVNGALGGLAAILGAVLSGVLALFGSFRFVFLVSAGALLASIPLWAAAYLASERRKAPVVTVVRPPPSERPVLGRAETD